MSSNIRVRVGVDRKAALLAGRVLGETVDIEVSPDTLGRHWESVVRALDMSTTPPSLQGNTYGEPAIVTDGTTEELVRVLDGFAHTREAEKRDAEEKVAAKRAEYPALLAAREAALSEPLVVTTPDSPLGYHKESCKYLRLPVVEPRKLPSHKYYEYGCAMGPDADYQAAVADQDRRNTLQQEATLAAAMEIAAPDIERQLLELAAKEQAAQEAADTALAAKFAARLESGYYEEQTSSYNEKRYGQPWIAAVSFSHAGKAIYDFHAGEASGSWGKAGMRRIKCSPGDFIARGQKDLRRPGNSKNEIGHMNSNGGIVWHKSAASAFSTYRQLQAEAKA